MGQPWNTKRLSKKDEQAVSEIIENTDGVVLLDQRPSVAVDQEDDGVLWVQCWYRIEFNPLESRILKVLKGHSFFGDLPEKDRIAIAKSLAKEPKE